MQFSGPLFDGHAVEILAAGCRHAEDRLAEDLIARIRTHLAGVIRVNHGRYEAHIHSEDQDGHKVVTDRWIVYGPWLEGTGSRNSPVTRFPGYHTFRIVSQEFGYVADNLVSAELDPYVAEVNM